jgi:hypothetical protein
LPESQYAPPQRFASPDILAWHGISSVCRRSLTLEKIAEKVDRITVGSFDTLLSNLVTLQK